MTKMCHASSEHRDPGGGADHEHNYILTTLTRPKQQQATVKQQLTLLLEK